MTTRRIVLAAGASLGATMVARVTVAEAQNASKTFVLVHGAWHGGWCWRRVSDLLERKGHKVFTPTLTGLGERSHLMSRDINLDTHIMDVVNVIKWEGLKDVCLVAHSYGGWPVSGAIEQSLVGPGRAIRVSLPQFFCDVLPSSPFWPLVRFGSISVALAGCYFATALASLDENRTYTPPTVRDRPGSGMSASGRGAAIARCPLQVRDVPKQTLAAFV